MKNYVEFHPREVKIDGLGSAARYVVIEPTDDTFVGTLFVCPADSAEKVVNAVSTKTYYLEMKNGELQLVRIQ